MAGSTLQKLRERLKRWHSFHHCLPAAAPPSGSWRRRQSSMHGPPRNASTTLRLVYVGNSRRQYLVSSDVVDHPLFQVLARRCGDWDEDGAAAVGCEVVLFEHLILWIQENGAEDLQPDAIDELVEYYCTG
ncbi:hypothetical protein Cni_G11376 [Canna indica]|uniref:Uncharacterized protein n=1 Tax=Canna indica TaxID=4628 RepID=A0AAQ3KA62_9LILI|nr:hypothetical protein Cni_G11376 [Canna indica]